MSNENSFALINAINGNKATKYDRRDWRQFLFDLIDETKPGCVLGFKDPDEFEDVIKNSKLETYEHASLLQSGNFGLQIKNKFKGRERQLDLFKLPLDMIVMLVPTEDSAHYKCIVVNNEDIIKITPISDIFTIVLGINEYELEIVKALFPGDCLTNEIILLEKILPIRKDHVIVYVTVEEAIGLGFTKTNIKE